jgi:NDP-sugar pyrophosphorylase family protein
MAKNAPSAKLEGGSYVGAGSTVGAGSIISGSIIGRGALVGASVRLTRCHVAEGAKIPDGFIAEGEFFGFTPISGENPYK